MWGTFQVRTRSLASPSPGVVGKGVAPGQTSGEEEGHGGWGGQRGARGLLGKGTRKRVVWEFCLDTLHGSPCHPGAPTLPAGLLSGRHVSGPPSRAAWWR